MLTGLHKLMLNSTLCLCGEIVSGQITNDLHVLKLKTSRCKFPRAIHPRAAFDTVD